MIAIVIAIGAAAFFGVGVALQQHTAAMMSDELTLRPGLLARLVRQRNWLIGGLADVGGFGLQTWALTVGSLVVVQPVLTTNLVFALAISAVLARRPLSSRQWWLVLGTLGCLVIFLSVARPTAHSDSLASTTDWLTIGFVVGAGVVGLLLAGRQMVPHHRALLFGLAAGTAEGFMAVVAKTFGDDIARRPSAVIASWETVVLIVCGLSTVLIVQSAYQLGLPTITLPTTAVSEPIVATALGVLMFGERLHVGGMRSGLVVFTLIVMTYLLGELARDHALHESGSAPASEEITRHQSQPRPRHRSAR
jgi:drug/metabolite transporter (DMT)-like permease